jgi:hypothetical protein
MVAAPIGATSVSEWLSREYVTELLKRRTKLRGALQPEAFVTRFASRFSDDSYVRREFQLELENKGEPLIPKEAEVRDGDKSSEWLPNKLRDRSRAVSDKPFIAN